MGTVALISGIAGALSAGASAYQSYEVNKDAKKLANEQKAELKKQEDEALKKRKTLIDQQRENLLPAMGTSSTSFTGASGIRGNLNNWQKNNILG